MSIRTETTIQTNFDLKNIETRILPEAGSARATLTVAELETLRTSSQMVPASKHGLEAICGASCETGAQ